MGDAKTPRVQLHLHLQGEEGRDEPRQRVLKATAGHEVVEAHWRGVAFQFSKKRKAEAPPAPAASRLPAPPSHLLRTPGAALTTAAAATAAPSPFADDVWMSQQQGERLLAGVAALPERAPPAQRLLAFAASLGEAAVAGAGPRAPALAAAYASFQDKLAAALTSGRVQLAAPPRPPATPGEDGEEVEQQRDYTVDLEARKAGLRARLAAFEKEEAEWHALVEKVAQLDRQQLVAADAEGADPAAAGGAAEPGPQQQQQQGEEQQEVPEEVAALARLHKDVHRHLAMQVEGVCKLVSDVEEMVERANRSAQAVQAEYQAEKLRVFPHINSPARLIRELVRPAAAPAVAAAAASPGGKAQQGATAAAADGKENAMEA